MTEHKNTALMNQINELKSQLSKEKKISSALLCRVKNHLNQYLSAKELFEHNSLLLDEIKTAKKELYLQVETSERLSYIASHDSLTGLINRSEFEAHLKQLVRNAKKYDQSHALCFLDLDQFKVVNDTAGHLAGDEMLRQLALMLTNHLRKTDTLARLGGDEFALIMDTCSKEHAEFKAKEILKLVEKFRFSWEDTTFSISFSIGITMINSKSTNHIDALKQADIACYSAKNAGRNRMRTYHPDGTELQYEEEILWIPRINDALVNDRFCLYVQEIKPTDPAITHSNFEVLVRLNSRDGRIIEPGMFLPVAERYNLANKIDIWVIKHTIEWLSLNYTQFHKETRFSINLSGQSIGSKRVLNSIVGLFNNTPAVSPMINFEITETMAISNLQKANSMIEKLKQYGCTFSLDDFGSGLSSFGYLKNLDVDVLKIDGVFVRNIINDKIDEAMVASIHTIGHVIGMKTVAEFVESEEIAEKLTEMGVDYLQGYGIKRPMPINEILPG